VIFIESAIGALPQPEKFDKEPASAAVARIREIRKGVTLNLQGMSIASLRTSATSIDASLRSRRLRLHTLVLRR